MRWSTVSRQLCFVSGSQQPGQPSLVYPIRRAYHRRMSETVNVQEAKTRLSELLAKAARGERVVIARAGVPVARLEPVDAVPARTFGTMSFSVPQSFFEPLPDSELGAWE